MPEEKNMALELTSLEKAVASLERAVDESRSPSLMDKLPPAQREIIRAGVIQNFEFTFDLCWKFMQRWIRSNQTPEDADFPRTRKDLFRTAARLGLVKDPSPWFGFSEARSLTAHTYDRERAEEIHGIAVRFAANAGELLEKLKELND